LRCSETPSARPPELHRRRLRSRRRLSARLPKNSLLLRKGRQARAAAQAGQQLLQIVAPVQSAARGFFGTTSRLHPHTDDLEAVESESEGWLLEHADYVYEPTMTPVGGGDMIDQVPAVGRIVGIYLFRSTRR